MTVDHEPVAFLGVLFRPVSKAQRTGQNLMAVSRVVTLPDWQGCGLAFALIDTVAGAYKAVGRRMNNYPAHPGFIRSHDRSPNWALVGKPGYAPTSNRSRGNAGRVNKIGKGRPSAVFTYTGPALPVDQARRLLAPYLTRSTR